MNDDDIDKATQNGWAASFRREVDAARDLGQRIGFGALMRATETAWRESTPFPGSEFAHGPCVAMLVACPARTLDADGKEEHYLCDWCCGAGRVTKRVARAVADAGDAAKAEER